MKKFMLMSAAMALAGAFAFAGPAYADKADENGLHCDGTKASHPCTVDTIIEVTKSLTDGPYTFDVEGPLNLGVRTDLVLDQDPNDDGWIAVGLNVPQHFAVEITILNDSGSDVFDLVVFDKIPADFNLDPAGEDAADGMDGNCDDGVCNGIDLSAKGACVLTESQPAGAVAGPKDPANDPFDQRFKEPELVSILVDNLLNAGTCTFTLYLVTDGNPGSVTTDTGFPQGAEQCIQPDDGLPDNCVKVVDSGPAGQIMLFDVYEPGKGELIAQLDGPNTDDVFVYNTVSLNDGVKVFQVADDTDAFDGTDGVDEGFLLGGSGGTLQLTPNGVTYDVNGALVSIGENQGECLNSVPVLP